MKNRPMTTEEIVRRDTANRFRGVSRLDEGRREAARLLRGPELTAQDEVNIRTQAGYLRRGRALRSPE